jgi:hypothetical protein
MTGRPLSFMINGCCRAAEGVPPAAFPCRTSINVSDVNSLIYSAFWEYDVNFGEIHSFHIRRRWVRECRGCTTEQGVSEALLSQQNLTPENSHLPSRHSRRHSRSTRFCGEWLA